MTKAGAIVITIVVAVILVSILSIVATITDKKSNKK